MRIQEVFLMANDVRFHLSVKHVHLALELCVQISYTCLRRLFLPLNYVKASESKQFVTLRSELFVNLGDESIRNSGRITFFNLELFCLVCQQEIFFGYLVDTNMRLIQCENRLIYRAKWLQEERKEAFSEAIAVIFHFYLIK